MQRMAKAFFFACTILLTGCAEPPREMLFFPGQDSTTQAKVWPSPPEVPRYRYAGQLTGEQNYKIVAQGDSVTGTSLFNWLVGLSDSVRENKQLLRPQAGLVDSSGRIYVTDAGKKAVFVFDQPNNQLLVWGKADANDHFMSPIGISQGPAGQILVADSQLARIIRIDHDGNAVGSIGKGILQRPTGLAFDPRSGWIYVADTAAHNIKVFAQTGTLIKTIGHRGTALGEFNAPTHIALAGDMLYVSDTLNARVQTFSVDGKALGAIGKRGLFVGNLTRPKGVTVDDDGNVYIIESYYDHLVVFNRQGDFLLPIGGSGNAIGEFYLPAGIWHDSHNRIYIADMFNNRVVILQYLGL